jgi:hypothetical protein
MREKIEIGEFILLGVMLSFVFLFLYDIRVLPLEGKFLSYLLAPFIVLCAGICLRDAWIRAKKTKEEKALKWPFFVTIGGGFFLFFSIYFMGFYLGSGLFLLLWFLVFKKITRATVTLIIALPLFLYLSFEVFLDMGLPKGVFWAWLLG